MLRSFPESSPETLPEKAFKFSNDMHLILFFSSLVSEKIFNSKRNKFKAEKRKKRILDFVTIETTFLYVHQLFSKASFIKLAKNALS